MEKNRIPKRVLYMNLESTRPRNGWQDEVREDRRLIGGEEWQEKLYDREEWKKLLRTARNCHILHIPMEQLYLYLKQKSRPETELKVTLWVLILAVKTMT
jgi:hypothetical protein